MTNRIKELRLKKELSLDELAEIVGVYKTSISKWEREINIPRADLAYYLAKALGVTIEHMMGWDNAEWSDHA